MPSPPGAPSGAPLGASSGAPSSKSSSSPPQDPPANGCHEEGGPPNGSAGGSSPSLSTSDGSRRDCSPPGAPSSSLNNSSLSKESPKVPSKGLQERKGRAAATAGGPRGGGPQGGSSMDDSVIPINSRGYRGGASLSHRGPRGGHRGAPRGGPSQAPGFHYAAADREVYVHLTDDDSDVSSTEEGGGRIRYVGRMLDKMPNYSGFLNQLTNFVFIPIFAALCLYQYFVGKLSQEVLSFPKKNFALMGSLDGVCGIMAVVGGVHTSGTAQVVLSQLGIPVMLLLCRFMLGKRYNIIQHIGAAVIIFGVLVVESPGLLHPTKEDNSDLWRRLINGGKCFLGKDTIVPPVCGPTLGVACDSCQGAWVEVAVYILFNLIYNVCSMLVLKHCGATVLFLIMTVRLPLTSMAFYSRLIVGDSAVPAKATDFFGLLILLVGLLAFRLGGHQATRGGAGEEQEEGEGSLDQDITATAEVVAHVHIKVLASDPSIRNDGYFQ
ncbi:hypothetical protein, conserved [Eimeria maxima]|uniref:Chloroquine resistance transporter n=1 Tax=Eimeria maxima TaxID=5804 RepID=U6LYD5_EIMMA|nr:hypothetical protein, conserved [Eimeria maxima]CDJ56751.1 hypothetical protein, conserved [Eimeria maxima]